MKKYFLFSIIIFFANCLYATTYYVSINGSDSNTGLSQAQAWATFNYAISRMIAGDELLISNGVYYQSLYISKSGNLNSPIKIKAINDGKVTINGQSSRIPGTISGNYMVVEGIVFQHSSGSVVIISGDHNIFRRCSAYYGKFGGNEHCWEVSGQNNLLEDCVAAATERHLFLSWSSSGVITRNIFRRCFGYGYPLSGNTSACMSSFNIYGGSEDIVENCIAWGGDQYASVSVHSASWTRNYKCRNNKVIGSLLLRSGKGGVADPGLGLLVSSSGGPENPRDNYIENCIIYGNVYGARIISSCNNTVLNHCTIRNSDNYGISSENYSDIVKNSIIYYNTRGYATNQGSFININIYGNSSYNTPPNSWTGCILTDPLIDGFGVTIPDNSPCKGAGENGKDIGANIYYRYENGVLTSTPLWPWPMQERIKDELDVEVMTELEAIFGSVVNDNSLKADASASLLSGPNPLAVNFTGNARGGTPPYHYIWSFGDGTTSSQQNPSHTYNQIGNYSAILTITDNDNNHANSSITIEVIDPSNVLSIVDIKFTRPDQSQEITQIQRDTWYYLYLYFNTPNGWSEISFADVWISSPAYNEGTIENRGGVFHAASNYVVSFSVASGYEGVWVREIENSTNMTDVTGILALYVDARNDEYQINSAGGWIKAKMKLLSEAEPGNWKVNAYAKSQNGNFSSLYERDVIVVASDTEAPFPPQNVIIR